MIISELLSGAQIHRMDAEILLAYALKKNRTWLASHDTDEIQTSEKNKFDALVMRRRNHEPVAYITGEKEFYGRTFKVNSKVLIPRPATEALIDETKILLESGANQESGHITKADTGVIIFTKIMKPCVPKTIIDVGAGSGCVGITLALEIPDIKIICADISGSALEIAEKNAKRHGVADKIKFIKSDLLTSHELTSRKSHFLVVSNPPYVPDSEVLPPDVFNYEPHEALFAGPDGADVLTQLYEQCKSHTLCIGCVMEMREEQAMPLSAGKF